MIEQRGTAKIDLLLADPPESLARLWRPEAPDVLRGAAKNIRTYEDNWSQTAWVYDPLVDHMSDPSQVEDRAIDVDAAVSCGATFCTAGWMVVDSDGEIGPDTNVYRRAVDLLFSHAPGCYGERVTAAWRLFDADAHTVYDAGGDSELSNYPVLRDLSADEWAGRLETLAARIEAAQVLAGLEGLLASTVDEVTP
jgi:hypothetical protein